MLVLTDGKDEGSAALPAEVVREVQARGVLLDSVVVGAVPDYTLDAAAEMSGGSCHRPGSWAEAQALFEADAMVCFSSRQKLPRPPGAAASLQARAQQMRNAARAGAASTAAPAASGAPRLEMPAEVLTPRATTIEHVLPARVAEVSRATLTLRPNPMPSIPTLSTTAPLTLTLHPTLTLTLTLALTPTSTLTRSRARRTSARGGSCRRLPLTLTLTPTPNP